jgi:hypothetical protein
MSGGALQDFDTRANNPAAWLETARELLHAAERLHASIGATVMNQQAVTELTGCVRGSALLIGFALENALKGLAVHRGVLKAVGGSFKLNSVFGQHRLEEMATSLGVWADETSQVMLKRSALAIRWASRYPMPLSHREVQLDSVILIMSPTDIGEADRMIRAIEDLLQAA